MLSLSTAVIPLQPLSFEAKVKWILDGEIPGVIPGAQMTAEEIPLLIREATGAGHLVPAVETPRALPGDRPALSAGRIPSICAVEENERLLATESCLQSVTLAQQHEIAIVILSCGSRTHLDHHLQQEQVVDEIDAKKKRLGNDPRDPEVARWHEKLHEQQGKRLQQLTRRGAPDPGLLKKQRDSLLRSLDAVLQEASRRQIHVAVRESDQLGRLPPRDYLDELTEIFQGAPLGFVCDPAGASVCTLLSGLEGSSLLPDPQPLLGVILRDRIGPRAGALLGEGDLDMELQFGNYAANLLRIIEAPPATDPVRIQQLAATCRQLGIDGDAPPQPADAFPIIGGP
ncbi:MAG: hypothetical protein AAEJ65_00020 [Planctomycetota bacterium]